MNNDKNGKNILITIGWLSAVLALGFFPLFLGIVACCMGVVLKRDYEATTHGRVLMFAGVIGFIGGWIINYVFLQLL
ncbi:hypothetical protein ACULLL_09780 [Lysinibacillus irui]|uniref:hypothetical protein n=1 Tax=Lysinibacillus irui TaxID=2998077 RepID=UPI0040440F46